MKSISRQGGFTLIELVVVIVILGILAAVALPRFGSLQVQARQAKLQGAIGAMRGASALFHAQCLANANSGVACPATGVAFTINMEGSLIAGVNQYPAASVAGIITAAGLNTVVPNPDFTATVAGTTITIDVPGPTAGTCRVTYTAATAAAGAITAAPTTTITAASTACL